MISPEPVPHPTTDFAVRLDCGHRIEVPIDAAVPAMMACLVHHRSSCSHAEPEGLEAPGYVVPMRLSWGGALR